MRRATALMLLLLAVSLLPFAVAQEDVLERGFQRAGMFAYYPSLNELWVHVDFSRRNVRRREIVEAGQAFTALTVTVLPEGGGKPLASETAKLDKGVCDDFVLKLPKLDGTYTVRFEYAGPGGPKTVTRKLVRKHYPWEGNKLGVSEEVPVPFEPVAVQEKIVSVVMRRMTVNGFGLFDSVVARGKELLAGPMVIRYTVGGREGIWQDRSVKLLDGKPLYADFTAAAVSDAVVVNAVSRIEVDGCTRVDMELAPGKAPAKIDKLWIEIPMKRAEAVLFHQTTDGPRINYAGAMPAGEGVVWDSSKARWYGKWENTFVPYIWMGNARRGLAWFAENDRGWATEKGGSQAPLQDIVRSADRVTLRVYLVNTPTTLDAPRKLTFGVQASPTKPMPENWRSYAHRVPKMGGPVVPWGGLHCAYKFPVNDDWEIADKIIQTNKGAPFDQAWFEAYQKKHDIPPVFGTRPWLVSVKHFATQRTARPAVVYHEEHASSQIRPEFETFQDEWGLQRYTHREWADMSIMRKGFNANPSYKAAHTPSYIDYGTYYANEWLKRGVGLYWDNDYLKLCTDTRISAAYTTEDGQVQPAMNIWGLREYHKRVWNLLQYWRVNQADPLEWSGHMTNALVLPVHTWLTATLDHELGVDKPFSPEWIRTETLGVHVGAIPHSLYQLYGRHTPVFRGHPNSKKPEDIALNRYLETQAKRTDWGMSVVHEVTRGLGVNPRERWWRGVGYIDPKATVHTYYDETPVAEVDNPQVKWIALSNAKDRSLVMVCQSWSAGDEMATLGVDPKKLGFDYKGLPVDPETGIPYARRGGMVFVELPKPYGTRLIQWIDPDELTDGVLLADNFENDVSAQWSYCSLYVRSVPEDETKPQGNKVLRFGGNTQRWHGHTRLELWPVWPRPLENAGAYDGASVTLRFRLGKVPEAGVHPVFYLVYGGGEPGKSQHGVRWMNLSGGVQPWVYVDAENKTLMLGMQGLDKRVQPAPIDVPMDTAWHTMSVSTAAGQLVVMVDDKQVWQGKAPEGLGGGVGIRAADVPEAIGHVDFDDVVIREKQKE